MEKQSNYCCCRQTEDGRIPWRVHQGRWWRKQRVTMMTLQQLQFYERQWQHWSSRQRSQTRRWRGPRGQRTSCYCWCCCDCDEWTCQCRVDFVKRIFVLLLLLLWYQQSMLSLRLRRAGGGEPTSPIKIEESYSNTNQVGGVFARHVQFHTELQCSTDHRTRGDCFSRLSKIPSAFGKDPNT